MDRWHRVRCALAVIMCALCAAICMARSAELRRAEGVERPAAVLMRCSDRPVVAYPDTREAAVHGTPVTLRFGDEAYEIVPTADELAYGMRWSREP